MQVETTSHIRQRISDILSTKRKQRFSKSCFALCRGHAASEFPFQALTKHLNQETCGNPSDRNQISTSPLLTRCLSCGKLKTSREPCMKARCTSERFDTLIGERWLLNGQGRIWLINPATDEKRKRPRSAPAAKYR